MIWQIYYDDQLIYDPRLSDDVDYQLSVRDATLTLGLSSAGSLVFTMDKTNPFQSSLQLMRGKVKVVQSGTTDTTRFIGRIVNLEKNFDLSVTVTCEGALAWTNDSYMSSYIFPDTFSPTGNTVEWWLNYILGRHNVQRYSAEGREITLGTVNVTAPDNYIYRKRDKPTNIWTVLKEDFVESELGGYFRVRYSGDTVYLDYLSSASGTNDQPVEYALNLLDITDGYSGSEMFNAILPTGKDESGNPVSIGSITNGYYDENGNYSATYQGGYRYYKQSNYILDYESRDTYGVIFRTVEYEGLTTAADVFSAGLAALNAHVDIVPRTISISAVDLAGVSNVDGLGIVYDSMSIGSYVKVYSAAHGLDTSVILTELSIDLCDPTASTITLGSTAATISSTSAGGVSSVISGVGGGGTTDYNDLENKPQINSVVLSGDKSSHDDLEISEVYVQTTEPTDPIDGDLWINLNESTQYSYETLTNKPSINGVTLTGNKTAAQLSLFSSNGGTVSGDVVLAKEDSTGSFAIRGVDGGGTTRHIARVETVDNSDMVYLGDGVTNTYIFGSNVVVKTKSGSIQHTTVFQDKSGTVALLSDIQSPTAIYTPASTDTMAAGAITVTGLSNYSCIEIVYITRSGTGTILAEKTARFYKNSSDTLYGHLEMIHLYDDTSDIDFYMRNFTIAGGSDTITFLAGRSNSAGVTEDYAKSCIVTKIYGIM